MSATRQAALVEALREAEDYLRNCANSPALADKCRAALAQAEAAQPPNCGACPGNGTTCPSRCRLADDSPPAEAAQPVAGWQVVDKFGIHVSFIPRTQEFFGSTQENEAPNAEQLVRLDRDWAGLAPHRVVPLYAAPQHTEAQPQWKLLEDGKTAIPADWTWCRIEHEPGYPEDVAFGPPRLMEKLKGQLQRYYAMLAEAAPKQEAVTDERAAFEKWAKAHGRIFLNRRGEGYIHQFTMEAWVSWQARAALSAQPQQPAPEPVALTVRVCSFPESNGKRNWTAMVVRKTPWDGLIGNCGGVTIAQSECWNRVAYEAERARFLLGERDTEPYILDYGDDIQTPEQWAGEVRGGRPVRAPQTHATNGAPA